MTVPSFGRIGVGGSQSLSSIRMRRFLRCMFFSERRAPMNFNFSEKIIMKKLLQNYSPEGTDLRDHLYVCGTEGSSQSSAAGGYAGMCWLTPVCHSHCSSRTAIHAANQLLPTEHLHPAVSRPVLLLHLHQQHMFAEPLRTVLEPA